GQPTAVALRPVTASLVSQPMPKQEAEQLLLSHLHGIHRLLAGADQVAHGFLLLIRRPDRRQLTGAPQPCQHFSVPTISLHPVPGLSRDHRRRDNRAFKPELGKMTMQAVAAGARLVTKARCTSRSRQLLG